MNKHVGLDLVGHQYVTNLALTGLGLVTQIFLINSLHIEDYGTYGFLLSFHTMLTLFCGLGVAGSFQKQFPKLNDCERDTLVISSLKCQLTVLIIFCIPLIFFLGLQANAIFVVAYSVLVTICNTCVRDNLVVRGQLRRLYGVEIGSRITQFAIIYIASRDLTLSITEALSAILAAELFVFLSIRLSKFDVAPVSIVALISENWPFIRAKLAEPFMLKMPGIWFVMFFLGPYEAGIYTFIVTLSYLFSQNFSVLRRLEVLLNRKSLEDGKVCVELLQVTVRAHFCIITLLISGLFLFKDLFFVYFLDDKYRESFDMLFLLLPLVLVAHTYYLQHPHCFVNNDVDKIARSVVVGAITHLVFLIALVPTFGVIGAVSAMALGYLARGAYLLPHPVLCMLVLRLLLISCVVGVILVVSFSSMAEFTSSIFSAFGFFLISIFLLISPMKNLVSGFRD